MINILDKIILFLFLLSLFVIASRGCEVLNLNLNKCEIQAEQNLTLNPAWIEFY